MSHGIDYRIMCYFHSQLIFEVPEIAALDYYLRMDDDSRLVCQNGNAAFNRKYQKSMRLKLATATSDETEIMPDLFEYMASNGYLYAYWKCQSDPHSWTRNFIPFIVSYLQRNGLSFQLPVPQYMTDWLTRQWMPPHLRMQAVPMFYNNLELLFVPFFRAPFVSHFNEAVERTDGYWLHRWGDAIIR